MTSCSSPQASPEKNLAARRILAVTEEELQRIFFCVMLDLLMSPLEFHF